MEDWGLSKCVSALIGASVFEKPQPKPDSKTDKEHQVLVFALAKVLSKLNDFLKDSKHVGGKQRTLADIYVAGEIMTLKTILNHDMKDYPNVRSWYHGILLLKTVWRSYWRSFEIVLEITLSTL
jgi:glutathione S-transferase